VGDHARRQPLGETFGAKDDKLPGVRSGTEGNILTARFLQENPIFRTETTGLKETLGIEGVKGAGDVGKGNGGENGER
jgi:hypothetical protein